MSNIYFIADGSAIKIGRSGAVGERFRALEVGNPNDLELIACVEGGPGHEKAIHKELSAYRLRGEWFADCAEVRAAIARYQAAGAPLMEVSQREPVSYETVEVSDLPAFFAAAFGDSSRLVSLHAELDKLRAERRRLESILAEKRSGTEPSGPFLGRDP